MILLDGKKIAGDLISELAQQVEAEVSIGKDRPKLVVVSVGEDPASKVFLKIKETRAKLAGLDFELRQFPEQTSREDLVAAIQNINGDLGVTACVIQLPLPKHLDTIRQQILDTLDVAKDVDVLTSDNKAALSAGHPRFIPPTPAAILELLARYGIDPAKHKTLLVGRGKLVGAPLAEILEQKGIEFDVVDEFTSDITPQIQTASLVISGVGRPGLITADMVKEGSVLVDAGTSEFAGVIVGDMTSEAYDKASYAAPVPGGVGPMTVAMLFQNVWRAYFGVGDN